MGIKIVIDATAAMAGGAVTYLLNLLPALANIDRDNDYMILLSDTQDRIQLDLPSNFQFKSIHFLYPKLLWRLLWEQTVLPGWLVRWHADVLYAPMDIASLLAPCPVVLAVRNPNPYYDLEISGNARIKFLLQKRISRLSARKAHKVIFVSHNAKNTMLPQLNIPIEKGRVVYHGSDHDIFDISRTFESIPVHFQTRVENLKPFVLSVSSLTPHKNYETLLRGWAQLPAVLRKKYKLVIAGGCYILDYQEMLIALASQLDIADEVIFLGEVAYPHIPYLYAQASAFVLSSYLETFGHPLVEAMAMHVPIVAADNTCIPEVVGDAGLFFETTDEQALAQQLTHVLTDCDLRETLARKGRRRSKKFSWTQTAQQTLAILEEAAETNR